MKYIATPVKSASLLFFEELNPDEIKETKISLGRQGRRKATKKKVQDSEVQRLWVQRFKVQRFKVQGSGFRGSKV